MRPQFTQFNVTLAVDGTEPLGLSIRTIHNTHGTFHEVARVVDGGQAEHQDVRLGDIVIGVNHSPIGACLTHSQVVQLIVRASKRWKHMKLNLVRNHHCSEADQSSLRTIENGYIVQLPTADDTACAVSFAGSQFLFRGCGPEPVNPKFVFSWKQVVAVQFNLPVHIWFTDLCKRAAVPSSVSNAALRLQRKLPGKTIRRMLHILMLPQKFVEQAHLLLCLRIMTKYIEDEADVDDMCQCSMIEHLQDITDAEWAKLEFKLCDAIEWKLRELAEMQTVPSHFNREVLAACTHWCAGHGGGNNSCSCGYKHQHSPRSMFEEEFLCKEDHESSSCSKCASPSTDKGIEKPRRLSDAEDRIALELALEESSMTHSPASDSDHLASDSEGTCESTPSSVPSSTMSSPRFDGLPPSPTSMPLYCSPPASEHTPLDHQRLLKQSPVEGSLTQRREASTAAAQRLQRYSLKHGRIGTSFANNGASRVLDFVREKWQKIAGTPIESSSSSDHQQAKLMSPML